jgi:hypothetical protein
MRNLKRNKEINDFFLNNIYRMESEVWTFERIMEEIHKEYHVVPMNLKNIMDIFDDHLKLGDALDKLNEDELKYFRLHLQNSKIIRENALTHTIYHEKIKENRKIMGKYHKKFSNETKMLMCWLIENKNRFKINDFSIELL